MKKIKHFLKKLWKDEEAQGATEYILLIVVIVGLLVAFKEPILNMIKQKTEQVKSQVLDFK
ncbi:MAG: hypothetical protein D6797_01265 [Bdellovibrio sp.]|nr:MAG: hypothetical protein D6797_01265 [Bdellovibrio sp.]